MRSTILILLGLLSLASVAIDTAHSQTVATAPVITDDLDRESLRLAISHSVSYLSKLPPDRIVGEQPRQFTAREVLDSLAAFDKLLERWNCWECFAGELNDRFELVPSSKDEQQREVLFTGYYQPVIDGSLIETDEYRSLLNRLPLRHHRVRRKRLIRPAQRGAFHDDLIVGYAGVLTHHG